MTRKRAEWERHAWTLLVLAEIDDVVTRKPLIGRLRRPNVQFRDDLTRTLGHWDADRRLITLSGEVVRADRWQALIAVIEHEVAHQVVSEMLGGTPPGEGPHGPTFARACALVGVDPRATVGPEILQREPPTDAAASVRRKIAKLLALGSSPEPHEAEAALRKAHELALKHNVALLESGPGELDYELRLLGKPMKRVPSYYWTIMSILEEFYFVLYISRSCRDRNIFYGIDGGSGMFRMIEVYGTAENLDAAEYVFHYLLEAGEREWARYRFKQGLLNDRQKRSFLWAMYDGFRSKLRERQVELETTRALVWKGDPALRTFYRGRNPHVRRFSVGGARHYADADAAGREAGRRLRIHPGLRRGAGAAGGVRGLLENR